MDKTEESSTDVLVGEQATEGDARHAAVGDEAAADPQATVARKRAMARSVIVAFAGAGAAVTAIPIPVRSALMLSPMEMAEINALAEIYDIPQEESVRKIMDTLIELGVLSVAARHVLGAVEARQRVRLAAATRNAAVAAAIVAGIGLASAYAFDQVYVGKRTMDELGLVQRLRESEAVQGLAERASAGLGKVFSEETIEGLKTSASSLFHTLVPTA